jgi:hypothetical protein
MTKREDAEEDASHLRKYDESVFSDRGERFQYPPPRYRNHSNCAELFGSLIREIFKGRGEIIKKYI